MKTKLLHGILILLVFLLQCTLVNLIAIGSITPNLLIILCVSFGLMRGRKSGMWTGFFSGLLVDLFFGPVLGFYTLCYMYVGYLSGYAHRSLYDDDIKVPMFMTALADLGYNFAVYALQFLLRGRLSAAQYLIRIILPEMCYATLLVLLVYRPIRALNYRYLISPWKERDSVWVLK